MQEDAISDSSSSRTISNANEGEGDEGDSIEETSNEELSHSEHDSAGSSSTDSVSTEDPNKPKVTEGKAQLSPKSLRERSRIKIAEAAREIAEEEAAKAKNTEGKTQAKGTAGTKDPISEVHVRSPRVKIVAPKRRKMLVDEESSSEELSDTSPLKQRRSIQTNDPLQSQRIESKTAPHQENPKAKGQH